MRKSQPITVFGTTRQGVAAGNPRGKRTKRDTRKSSKR